VRLNIFKNENDNYAEVLNTRVKYSPSIGWSNWNRYKDTAYKRPERRSSQISS